MRITMEPQLRVLLVDSVDLVHWGLRAVLSRQPWIDRMVGAHDASTAAGLARRYKPHVAVVAIPFGAASGVDVCAGIARDSPETRILLMADDAVSGVAVDSFGAIGVVPRSWSGPDIAGAIRSVGLGMSVVAPDAIPLADLLTDRERVILAMIAEGSTNPEIAERLSLSPHTIKDHVSGLYRKIEARNRAEAIVRAQRLGLIA